MLMLELLQTFLFINTDSLFYAYPEKSLGLKKTSSSDEINNFEDDFKRSFYLVLTNKVPHVYYIFRHIFCFISVL